MTWPNLRKSTPKQTSSVKPAQPSQLQAPTNVSKPLHSPPDKSKTGFSSLISQLWDFLKNWRQWLPQFLKGNWPIILLLIISLSLWLCNYQAETFLIGYDDEMVEFDLATNWQRAWHGFWQEYRGLGLYDGMVHAANLVHVAIMAILKIFLPLNILRYVLFILLHFCGGLGVYLLLKKLLSNTRTATVSYRVQLFTIIIPSLLAALFYQFNIGTIQQFYLPYEAFAFHFAALPWLAYSVYLYFEKPVPPRLLFFALLALVATPQAHVSTLFIVYFILFGCLLLFGWLRRKQFRPALILLLVAMVVNLFWLPSYLVGIQQTGAVIENARINQFSSPEIYANNMARGTFMDVVQMQGFLFDTLENHPQTMTRDPIMGFWNDYIHHPAYLVGYYVILVVIFLGIVGSFASPKRRDYLIWLAPLGISFLFLASHTPVFEQLNELIRQLPLIGEAFRFSFTKFIFLFGLCFAVFLGLGANWLFELILNRSPRTKKRELAWFGLLIGSLGILVVALVLIGWPSWQNKFFSPMLKNKLPGEYLEMFTFFQSQDHQQRVALLPAHTFWSWQYREWGQFGSDFIWFGIPQALMSRAFDPWSAQNEQFYNELRSAYLLLDSQALADVVGKYHINYFLVDTYLIPDIQGGQIDYQELLTWLTEQDFIIAQKTFGRLHVFQTNLSDDNNFIQVTDQPLPRVAPANTFTYQDFNFQELGNYLDDEENPDIIRPFPGFFSEKLASDLNFRVQNKDQELVVYSKFQFSNPRPEQLYELRIPSTTSEYLIPAQFQVSSVGDQLSLEVLEPQFVINNVFYKKDTQLFTWQSSGGQQLVNWQLRDTSLDSSQNGEALYNTASISDQLPHYLVRDHIYELTLFFADGGQSQYLLNPRQFQIEDSVFIVELPEKSNFSVILQKFTDPYYFSDLDSFDQYRYFGNKEDFSVSGTSVDLTAVNDDLTEIAFYLEDIPHQMDFLVLTDSQYQTGLPISLYIDDTILETLALETRLSTQPTTQDINYLATRSSGDQNQGYGFHYRLSGRKGLSSASTLGGVWITPFPGQKLSQIKLTALNDQGAPSYQSRVTQEGSSGLTIMPLWKNQAKYLISLDGEASSSSNQSINFQLMQQFDRHWIAYRTGGHWWQEYWPFFILSGERLDHQKLNSWASNFTLTDGEDDRLALTGDQIVIIFWPQYLMNLGCLVIGGTFIWLIILTYRYRQNPIITTNKSRHPQSRQEYYAQKVKRALDK